MQTVQLPDGSRLFIEVCSMIHHPLMQAVELALGLLQLMVDNGQFLFSLTQSVSLTLGNVLKAFFDGVGFVTAYRTRTLLLATGQQCHGGQDKEYPFHTQKASHTID